MIPGSGIYVFCSARQDGNISRQGGSRCLTTVAPLLGLFVDVILGPVGARLPSKVDLGGLENDVKNNINKNQQVSAGKSE